MAKHVHTSEDPSTGIYTCPMHPEVRQKGPGKCPQCGMFLVPEVAGGHEHHGHGGALRLRTSKT